jgi:CubicO group peptidase (beta-lactamase class C family)
MRTDGKFWTAPTAALATLAALALVATLTTSCSTGSPITKSGGPVTFVDVDGVISRRIAGDDLDGAALLVVRDGKTFRDTGYSAYNSSTVVPIASASKWLTAATTLSLVDEGLLALDDNVRDYLPEFTGLSFESAFQQRIAGPVGMSSTTFVGNFYPTAANPVPAASAQSNLDDYGRFVKMLSQGGEIDGTRVLSESSVLEMERDQVSALNTSADSAVRTTGIPSYGLGTWRDVVTTDDRGLMVSGNGAYGFYPWIDRARDSYGVLLVFDERGSDVAVPESQMIVYWAWAALDNETGAPVSPSTTTFGR